MSVNTKDILEELYALDPDLRQKEAEITKIIERMIHNRPEVEINEIFRAELREKIMQEIHTARKPIFWFQWGPMVGVLSVCLVFVMWFGFVDDSEPSHTLLSFQPIIESAEKESFGPITLQAYQSHPRPQSGGGGLGGGGDALSSKMMAPDAMIYPPIDMPLYTYTYNGTITIPSEELPVYKKSSLPFDANDTVNIIKNLTFSDIDLSAFRQLGVSNLTLTEEAEYGYMLTLDFFNGTMNMYQNYTKWPQPACDASGCTQPSKLTEKDIPSDEEIIQASQNFINKYGIDTRPYGTPVVDKTWRLWYARSAEIGQEQIVPDMYTITYPIMLDDKTVYQEGGTYRGLTFNYDVRTKRITGMYGIEKNQLKKSPYETIKDPELIQEMIKSGGRYIMNDSSIDKERKVVELTLTEPTLNYVTIYGEWKDGKTEEYYVPAYIFSVENPPKEGYAPSNVVVPLVEEFVQRVIPGPTDPIIYSTEPVVQPAVIKE